MSGSIPCRRAGLLAAAAILGTIGLALGAAPAQAADHSRPRPGGLLGGTTTVSVPATTAPTGSGMPGVDTEVYLAPGQAAVITATGTANCNSAGPDSGCYQIDANGADRVGGAGFFDPDARAYSLVGEVGSGPVTFVGAGPTTVRGAGELRLEYNDFGGVYNDNGGGFTVTVQTCSLYGLPIVGPPLCSLLGPILG